MHQYLKIIVVVGFCLLCTTELCIIIYVLDCKRSPTGSEYMGRQMKASTGAYCMLWANMQTALANLSIQHEDFQEDNIIDAMNYCRNPNAHKDGPWCFVDEDGERETCYIPFCGEIYSLSNPFLNMKSSVDTKHKNVALNFKKTSSPFN